VRAAVVFPFPFLFMEALMVTLYPNYVRMIANSYRLLRDPETTVEPKVAQTWADSADRCIRAHMRTELQLAPDVKLPMPTVLMMLEYVRAAATERAQGAPAATARVGVLRRVLTAIRG
jgi:hypothetical protein